MRLAPREEVYGRVSKLQALLRNKGIVGIFVNQLTNIFYYSGTLQGTLLFIPDAGEPVLFTCKNLSRVRNECPLENVLQIEKLSEIPKLLYDEGYEEPDILGLELDFLPVKYYNSYKKLYPHAKFENISKDTRIPRMIKSPYEIKIMTEAGHLITKVYEKIPNMIQKGMTEMQLAAKIEYEMRKAGHQGILRVRAYNQEAFYGHVLFGENALIGSYLDSPTGGRGLSAAYPQGAGMTTLDKGKTIFIDYAFVLDGYIVDVTRIYSLGKLEEELLEAHQVALNIEKQLTEAARPGVDCAQLYKLAMEKVKEAELEANFMGVGENKVKFIGHGVGLELDELPIVGIKSKEKLQEGMIIALEPKFFFPRKGAVGTENSYIVRANGLEKLCSLTDEITCVC
ncbi:Xaa-Pro aminopeptidase [Desulfitispora alkaliphila]|uniref:M24 family metallopeptidase n=1 Tax=Desulfitispora alkaliphila TaxID=622674 RepID=UPI003D1B45FB